MANIVIVDGGAGGMVIATKLSHKRGGVLVEGKIAHLFNTSLYRRHLIKLHGIFKRHSADIRQGDQPHYPSPQA